MPKTYSVTTEEVKREIFLREYNEFVDKLGEKHGYRIVPVMQQVLQVQKIVKEEPFINPETQKKKAEKKEAKEAKSS